MNKLIQELKKKQLVWQGSRKNIQPEQVPSGYREIDEKLQGGLPKTGIIDIDTDMGIGELRLMMPYVAQLAQQRLVVFINPPAYISAEYLYREGIALAQVIIIQVELEKDALWAAEQCLKSGACCAVIQWYQNLAIHQVKRLKNATNVGESLHVLFKKQQQYALSLPVTLSMKLTTHSKGVNVSIPKRKGGWPIPKFSVDMSKHWSELIVPSSAENVVPFPKAHVL
ncbi:translesion DNA synthesis-associated protein ImuA [Thalassotalea atypica]|uniref:translesion DNA synthesis-associated protein ImuA n=1 Tax=Thalassotalea atypica TaxID=2054316 RepID=UPI002573FB6B|nr:translesion DNA synthesis-associated protein ImuA [Thalassotalea atypica]